MVEAEKQLVLEQERRKWDIQQMKTELELVYKKEIIRAENLQIQEAAACKRNAKYAEEEVDGLKDENKFMRNEMTTLRKQVAD